MTQTGISGGSTRLVRIVNVDSDPDLAARPIQGKMVELVYVTNFDTQSADNPGFDTLQVGDVTGGDYAEIEADGTLILHGDATVWKDILQSVTAAQLESPAGDFQRNQAENSVTAETGARYPTDYISMNIQINHDWAAGTTVYPHIHWWQTEADMPNWLIGYRWQKQGSAKTTAWSNLPWTTNDSVWSAGTLNQITDFGGIAPPVGYSLSDILQLRLYRDVTNVSGLFAGTEPTPLDQDVVNFDVHYQIDSLGSHEEYAK